MEQMTLEQVNAQEIKNSGTSQTQNKVFDKNGYLLIRDLINPEELYCEVPKERGQFNYQGSLDRFSYEPIEMQVEGSVSRYSYPPYKEAYFKIKNRLEDIIGEKLFTTYYYDRFYFPGQELKIHADRPSCEISVTVHISTNLKEPWPIWIKGCDEYNEDKTQIIKRGDSVSLNLNAGDALLYKGCERPHWREPMPGKKRNIIRKGFGQEELYYHQIFFHYVLQDGNRAHFAWDMPLR
jgi:hypothetical protein